MVCTGSDGFVCVYIECFSPKVVMDSDNGHTTMFHDVEVEYTLLLSYCMCLHSVLLNR